MCEMGEHRECVDHRVEWGVTWICECDVCAEFVGTGGLS